ncbi:hypothetical protein NitYY0814_C1372 [Nitratiruptor sp. YY08-14]|nr:hypothetical protein NitYY0810_C1365 [Nitratiruptor sp. YY08-10]BCD64525.1 hypothetical protein NitYY0814_C1372 [Nitratiruptor sp. YY08-14]
MDLSKPVPDSAIVIAILFFILLTATGIIMIQKARRKD